ncbi:hypothetical protein [Shewanella xiamenensis]|uniref:hypothetical protein n=1 Tax=Shewanella xiamenensis TaxID=332186 RepID=UPI001CC625E2|nr:hypothetical protein [Shewanella xiamenensis]BDA59920.1 hypothetical protein NUITMVS1_13830 [Shewanella xiamenensis]
MPGVLIPEHGINAEWTHEDCFKVMDCDSSEFHNTAQVEAVISLWKVGTKSSFILEEWKHFCLTEKAVSDVYIRDSSCFANRGHRYDQSILTNLTLKYHLSPISTDYIGNHMFKSISFLELFLRKEEFCYGIVFWSIKTLVKIRRKLFFN